VVTFTSRPLYLLGKSRKYLLSRVGGGFGEEKKFFPLPGKEPSGRKLVSK